jgi:hypothetical protein
MDGGLTFLFTGGLRMAIRSFFTMRERESQCTFFPATQRKRILIVGAGSAGEKILREQDALLDAQLAELSLAADRFDAPAIKQTLRTIVPEYLPQDTASIL